MKTYYYRVIIASAILIFSLALLSSTVNARNYNYDVLEKAKSLQFEGTFTVKRGGQVMDVHELKPGDETIAFGNPPTYDSAFGYHPGNFERVFLIAFFVK